MTDRNHDWPSRLRIDPTAFIAPGARVVGEVTLGARSSVWFNTVLRGDIAGIEVGADTNIQDNSTVHVDEGLEAVIGARVTVGHRSIVHGCVIEDDCLVGMGAVVLSGARIGAGSLIGAASLVRERQIVPPGSLVLGAPARVVGQVTEAHRAAIANGTSHYVALARTYQARGLGSTLPSPARPGDLMPRAGASMDHLEWEQRLEVLRAGPRWGQEMLEQHGGAEAFHRRSGPASWSAAEVVCHLRDCDRDVFAPRLERVLTEDFPAVSEVPVQAWPRERGYAEADPEVALAEWREARERVMARLAPLGPEAWQRAWLHPARGPHTLADLVRYWTDHDLSHRRQIRGALEARA